jgi:murein L,D-transpeptidase YafK
VRESGRTAEAVRTLLMVAVLWALVPAAGASGQRAFLWEAIPRQAEAGSLEGGSSSGLTAASLFESDFLTQQLRFPRVLTARVESRFALKRLFDERGLTYPAAEIFMRVFKRERVLELWVRSSDRATFDLLKTYPICALAGELGPKRRQGDNQTPEGFYRIEHFNPTSSFYLSLHVDYPNPSDRILGVRSSLGGDIFIHGGCQAIGCVAVTDEAIKELYWISVESRAAGQRTIPVHIFPFQLSAENLAQAVSAFPDRPELVRFWGNLQPGYDYFERHRRLPLITVDARGLYGLAGDASLAGDRGEYVVPADGAGSLRSGTAVQEAQTGPRLIGVPVTGGG